MKSTIEGVPRPRRMTKGSSGYDFYAPYDIHLEPGVWTEVDTGIVFDGNERPRFDGGIYRTWEMQIYPRSSFGMKYGLKLRNTIGKIDSDYRDTIKVSLSSDVPLDIPKGTRFIQGTFYIFGVCEDEDEPTDSRNGGLGSTGSN